MLKLCCIYYDINNFFSLLSEHFKQVNVTFIRSSKLEYSDLSKYDLFFIQANLTFTSEKQHHIIRDIHPNFLINGRIISTAKSFVSEMYNKYFNNQLTVYHKDVEKYQRKVFRKQEFQTIGRYGVKDNAYFDKVFLNQKYIGFGNSVYGLYFINRTLLYMYQFISDGSSFYTKLRNTKDRIFYSFEDTAKLLSPHTEALFNLLDSCGVDFGRVDLLFQDGNIFVIDVNSKPFLRDYNLEKYKKTGLLEKSAEIVEKVLIEQHLKNKRVFYNGKHNGK